MSNVLDWSKPIQTRDGRKARVICDDLIRRIGKYTHVVLTCDEEGNECVSYRTADGHVWPDNKGNHAGDIVNTPDIKTRYISVYDQPGVSGSYLGYEHESLEDANRYASSCERLAILAVEIDFHTGKVTANVENC